MKHGSGQRRRALRAGPFEIADTRHAPGLVLPRHAHASACVHFVLEGVYQEATRRGAAGHAARTVLYKPAGEPHWNEFTGPGSRTLRIEVDPAALALPERSPAHFDDPGLRELAGRLADELRRPDDFSELAAEGLCLELVARLARAQRPTRRAGRDVAARAARWLDERYREPVRFADLARELDVNRSHLARAFREHRGCTLGEYVRRLRVEEVREVLAGTDRPLAQVALEAGFSDQSHCARVFRRLVGVSPSAYRRSR